MRNLNNYNFHRTTEIPALVKVFVDENSKMDFSCFSEDEAKVFRTHEFVIPKRL